VIQQAIVNLNGLRSNTHSAGTPQAEAVMLLHGFSLVCRCLDKHHTCVSSPRLASAGLEGHAFSVGEAFGQMGKNLLTKGTASAVP
jgi:hypothetical protein